MSVLTTVDKKEKTRLLLLYIKIIREGESEYISYVLRQMQDTNI